MESGNPHGYRFGAPRKDCLLCGSSKIAPICTLEGFTFFECQDCRLVFANPMAAGESVMHLYEVEDPSSERIIRKAASRMRRALLKVMTRFWPHIVGKEVIDIGCGGGFMVETMRRLGARAVGVDVDGRVIEWARKAFPRNRFERLGIDQIAGAGLGPFDFGYSGEVIEHLPDPNRALEAYRAALKVGGHIYLTTPDAGHSKRPKNIVEWDVFGPPEHIVLFTPPTLKMALEAHGFRVLKHFPDRKPGIQILAQRIA
jgi:SAM-dependent methyltransferase